MSSIETYLDFFRKGLDEVAVLTTRHTALQYPELVKTVTTNQAYHRVKQISGFGISQFTAEQAPIGLDARIIAGAKDIKPHKYTQGFTCSKETKMVDIYNVIADSGRDITIAHNKTKEIVAWGLCNNAFNPAVLGPDGFPLCAVNHPVAAGLASQSNRGDGVSDLQLSALNLETALMQMRKQQDYRGLKMVNVGKVNLYVHPDLYPLAWRIVNSGGMQGTANNDKNFLSQSRINLVVADFLTSSTAWFLRMADSNHNLYLLLRMPLQTDSEYVKRTQTYNFYISEEFTPFWSDWRRFWGTTGS